MEFMVFFLRKTLRLITSSPISNPSIGEKHTLILLRPLFHPKLVYFFQVCISTTYKYFKEFILFIVKNNHFYQQYFE